MSQTKKKTPWLQSQMMSKNDDQLIFDISNPDPKIREAANKELERRKNDKRVEVDRETQIIDEIGMWTNGLSFRELFNSMTHYDGNEDITEKEIREILSKLRSEKKIRRMGNGRLIKCRPKAGRYISKWED